jgi:crotonobetainyl-CoA:carnitine CoA-transferase CaiB-like acyl-CoA transferase
VYLTGVPALDWSVNRRVWQRNGNFSPYAPAAPEGIYPCAGEDRWIAITCATEEDWRRLAAEAGRPGWPGHPDFATLDARLAHRAALDAAIGSWTARCDAFELTERLQRAGVAAGVAQTAADRVERDPQLRHLNWLTELEATDFGRWPVAETSVKMSATPQHIGGPVDRAAPTYGEHNAEVYQRMLGLSPAEMAELAAAGAI